jgi:hypothetical protein
LMCDYGYEKKSILKNIIPSLYLNVFGDGRWWTTHFHAYSWKQIM